MLLHPSQCGSGVTTLLVPVVFNKIILPMAILLLLLLKKPEKNRPRSKRHRTGQLPDMRTAGEVEGVGFAGLWRS
jgi:hypothetical protein